MSDPATGDPGSRARRGPHGDAGLALVELLVGMVLIGIVGGLVSDAIISAFHSQVYVTNRAADLDGLRQALQRMTRDIRQGSVVSPTGSSLTVSVPTASGSRTLTWQVDPTDLSEVIQDPSVPGPPRTVVVLANLDGSAAGSVFTYLGHAGYTPAVAGAVDKTYCTVAAAPGTFAPECVGTVTIHLRATVPGHPDLELSDSVDVRNAGAGQ